MREGEVGLPELHRTETGLNRRCVWEKGAEHERSEGKLLEERAVADTLKELLGEDEQRGRDGLSGDLADTVVVEAIGEGENWKLELGIFLVWVV